MKRRFVFYSKRGSVQGFRTLYEVTEGDAPLDVLYRQTPGLKKDFVAFEPYDDWVRAGSIEDPQWVNDRIAYLRCQWSSSEDIAKINAASTKPGPRKPVPAIPPEIHATKPFDPVAAWEAVKALSKGS